MIRCTHQRRVPFSGLGFSVFIYLYVNFRRQKYKLFSTWQKKIAEEVHFLPQGARKSSALDSYTTPYILCAYARLF